MSIKIAALYAELKAKDELTPALQKTKSGLMDIRGGIVQAAATVGTLTAAYYIASKAINATVGEFVKYANQVRTVNQLTGQTSEESSKLIQVLDDYKIGIDNINAASRTFIQNGNTMSTETLAKLSDQYNNLTTVQEKNAFMLQNFGRDYQKFLLIMEAGGDTILRNADAVSKGLILDKKALERAREYEIALDDLSDAFQALKVGAGGLVIGPLSDLIKSTNSLLKIGGELSEVYGSNLVKIFSGDFAGALDDARSAGLRIMATIYDVQHGTTEFTDALDAADRATNGLTDSTLFLDTELIKHNGIIESRNRIMDDLSDKMTGIISYVDALKSADESQTQQWIANMLLQKLSVDGLSDAEYDYYLQYMETTGQMTAAQIANAEAAWDTVNALAAMADRTITVTINTVVTGQSYVGPTGDGTGGGGPTNPTQHDTPRPGTGVFDPVNHNWIPPVYWYGQGGDFITNGPQMIGVGENGPERVTVTPTGQTPGPVDLSNRTMDALARRMAAIMQMGAQ